MTSLQCTANNKSNTKRCENRVLQGIVCHKHERKSSELKPSIQTSKKDKDKNKKKKIPLIHNTRKFSVGNIKLTQYMTGRQCHAF